MTATVMMYGHALMDQVIECIVRDFSQWDQRTYARRIPDCGTVYCFAGLTCALHGLQPRFWPDSNYTHMLKDGRFIDEAARTLLNISTTQSFALFDSRNTLADLRSVVDQIKAGVQHPRASWEDDKWATEWPEDE